MDSCNNQWLYDRVNMSHGFAHFNNISITKVEGNEVEGELLINEHSLNPRGHVHGGCLFSLADTVAGTGAHTAGGDWVTLNSTFNYLRPGAGSKLVCRAVPQKLGRTVSVYDATLTDDQGRQVATGCFTFFRIG